MAVFINRLCLLRSGQEKITENKSWKWSVTCTQSRIFFSDKSLQIRSRVFLRRVARKGTIHPCLTFEYFTQYGKESGSNIRTWFPEPSSAKKTFFFGDHEFWTRVEELVFVQKKRNRDACRCMFSVRRSISHGILVFLMVLKIIQ